MTLTIEQIIGLNSLVKRTEDGVDHYTQGAMIENGWKELSQFLPSTFIQVKGWHDGHYRRVWISDADLSIVTYCEGDFSLEIAHSEAIYKREIQKCHNFYVVENGGINSFTSIPDSHLIAKAAIEEIPGIDSQPWRQYHLFTKNNNDYKDAIVSSKSKSLVLAKAAEILMCDPDNYSRIKGLVGQKLSTHDCWDLHLWFSEPGGMVGFGRSLLSKILFHELPEVYADINEPGTHIEFKNWLWRKHDIHKRAIGSLDLSGSPWFKSQEEFLKGVREKNRGSKKEPNQYPNLSEYFFDVWDLEGQGAIKVPRHTAQVTYYLAGHPFTYSGEVIAYRDAQTKQYVVQPHEDWVATVGYLVYWLEGDRLQLI
jgi:hypothetical protein